MAAARARTLGRFLEEVEYHGRRLAKLNMALGESTTCWPLRAVVDEVLEGRHAPAREQLQLISAHALQEAYYQVREAEAQVFYGLSHAEAEAEGWTICSRAWSRIVTRAFHARAGRLVLLRRRRETGAGALYRRRDRGLGTHAAYWSFPVRPMALLQLGFDKPYPWLPREQAMMQAVAERCAAAIERVCAWQAEAQPRRGGGTAPHRPRTA